MKHLLYLLVLILPHLASAQSLSVHGFGGVMLNSATSGGYDRYQSSKLNPVAGIGASYRDDRFEYGLSVSYRRFSFQKTLRFEYEFDPMTGKHIPGTGYDRAFLFRQSAITVAPLLNYHFGAGRFDWYAGVSPAYVRFADGPSPVKGSSWKGGSSGILAQGQLGLSYTVLPKIRCFAELGGGSVWMPVGIAGTMQFWTSSLSLGAQFQVWQKKTASTTPAAVTQPSGE